MLFSLEGMAIETLRSGFKQYFIHSTGLALLFILRGGQPGPPMLDRELLHRVFAAIDTESRMGGDIIKVELLQFLLSWLQGVDVVGDRLWTAGSRVKIGLLPPHAQAASFVPTVLQWCRISTPLVEAQLLAFHAALN